MLDHEKEVWAVVETCGFKYAKSSVFSTHWRKALTRKHMPTVELLHVDSIVRSCLMVPTSQEQFEYHEIWHPNRWAEEFHC